MPQGSQEYLVGVLTANHVLDTQPLEVAIVATSGAVDEDDWVPATWTGASGTTRNWRTTDVLDGTLDAGPHYIRGRLTDSPEIVLIHFGMLWVQ